MSRHPTKSRLLGWNRLPLNLDGLCLLIRHGRCGQVLIETCGGLRYRRGGARGYGRSAQDGAVSMFDVAQLHLLLGTTEEMGGRGAESAVLRASAFTRSGMLVSGREIGEGRAIRTAMPHMLHWSVDREQMNTAPLLIARKARRARCLRQCPSSRIGRVLASCLRFRCVWVWLPAPHC
jgi:hypothetical protein